MQFNFTKYSVYYYIFSGILIIATIVSLSMFGLKFGIEFVGGSNMQVDFQKSSPSSDAIQKALKSFNLGEITVQPTGINGAILQFKGDRKSVV
jgi:preprotein translocase subunit SecF